MSRATPGAVLAALSGQDSVVVIRRPLVKWLGCDVQARLLDQLLFEADKAQGDWFAVTDVEWCERLLVQRRPLATAREALVAAGLLEVKRIGVPARLHYRLDAERVFDAFAAHLAEAAPVIPNGITGCPKRDNLSSQTGQLSTISKKVKNGAHARTHDEHRIEPGDGLEGSDGSGDRWLPLKDAISAAFGGLSVVNAKGKLDAGVGQTIGILGKAAGDDPARALALWSEFSTSRDREFCHRFHSLPQAVGSWLGRRRSDVGATAMPAAAQPYIFKNEGGRWQMKSIHALRLEGLVGAAVDPLDRSTWPGPVLAAEAALQEVAR